MSLFRRRDGLLLSAHVVYTARRTALACMRRKRCWGRPTGNSRLGQLLHFWWYLTTTPSSVPAAPSTPAYPGCPACHCHGTRGRRRARMAVSATLRLGTIVWRLLQEVLPCPMLHVLGKCSSGVVIGTTNSPDEVAMPWLPSTGSWPGAIRQLETAHGIPAPTRPIPGVFEPR